MNEIIVNPDKSQAIIIKKNSKMKDSYLLNINDQKINSENCVINSNQVCALNSIFLHSVKKQVIN